MTEASIKSYHFSAEKRGPHVLISAGVHGDEFEPILVALELANRLKSALIAGKITILPVVNAPAYETGARCGADGVDLARICPGNKNGSVSERLASQVSGIIKQVDFFIDMHTGGNLFEIYPLVGYMLHSSPKILLQQQKMAKIFNLPVIWGTDSETDGRTLSVARDANIPAIYIEYGGGGLVKKKIVKECTEGCMNILESLKMIQPGKKSPLKRKYWVEDYIPGKGHLQSKMPAPIDGIFLSAVKLGETVKKKRLWGSIIDPHTGDKKNVFAEENGIVLFLRRAARVNAGDALGGILPIYKPGKKIILMPVK